jgi:hypothetical protein
MQADRSDHFINCTLLVIKQIKSSSSNNYSIEAQFCLAILKFRKVFSFLFGSIEIFLLMRKIYTHTNTCIYECTCLYCVQ